MEVLHQLSIHKMERAKKSPAAEDVDRKLKNSAAHKYLLVINPNNTRSKIQ